LGKVRPEGIKRIAKELIKKYPDRFSKNFEENKKNLEGLLIYDGKKMRNRVAGYIIRLKRVEEIQAEALQSPEESATDREN